MQNLWRKLKRAMKKVASKLSSIKRRLFGSLAVQSVFFTLLHGKKGRSFEQAEQCVCVAVEIFASETPAHCWQTSSCGRVLLCIFICATTDERAH